MSRIRGKNTSPELAVRRLLHRMGYRFRLHVRIPIPADEARESRESTRMGERRIEQERTPRYVCPDIVLPKYKTAIFVHGCFWHRHRGCKNCTTPTARGDCGL